MHAFSNYERVYEIRMGTRRKRELPSAEEAQAHSIHIFAFVCLYILLSFTSVSLSLVENPNAQRAQQQFHHIIKHADEMKIKSSGSERERVFCSSVFSQMLDDDVKCCLTHSHDSCQNNAHTEALNMMKATPSFNTHLKIHE